MLIAKQAGMETLLNLASRYLASQATFVIMAKVTSPTRKSPLRWTGSPASFDY